MMRRGEGSGGVPESDGVSRAQTEAQPILGQLQLLDLIVLTSHSSIFSEIDAGDPRPAVATVRVKAWSWFS